MTEFRFLPSQIAETINSLESACKARARLFSPDWSIYPDLYENLSVMLAIPLEDGAPDQIARILFDSPPNSILNSLAASGPCPARLDLSVPGLPNRPPSRFVLDGIMEAREAALIFSLLEGHDFFVRPSRVVPPAGVNPILSLSKSGATSSFFDVTLVADFSESGMAFLMDRRHLGTGELVTGSSWGFRLQIESTQPAVLAEGYIARHEAVIPESMTAIQLGRLAKLNTSPGNLIKMGISVNDRTYKEFIRPVLQSWIAQDPSADLNEQDPLALSDFLRRHLAGLK